MIAKQVKEVVNGSNVYRELSRNSSLTKKQKTKRKKRNNRSKHSRKINRR